MLEKVMEEATVDCATFAVLPALCEAMLSAMEAVLQLPKHIAANSNPEASDVRLIIFCVSLLMYRLN